jgi:hypothetical protein
MNATLKHEISRLTKRQKIALADRLLGDAGLHVKPPGIMASDDPGLDTELRRRLADNRPGAWLSLEEFRAKAGLR